MEDLRIELEKQLKQLDQYFSVAEKRVKKSRGVEKCTIQTSTRKNGYQYYMVEEGRRCYVRSADVDSVRRIVQKDYDELLYKELLNMRQSMRRFLKHYDPYLVTKAYSNLADARKPLVSPLIPTDEQYVEAWYLQHQGDQNTYPEKGVYLTARGEGVRSKSEKIIADLFDKHGIPYSYEPRLELAEGQCVFPDFAVLNVRRRKTMYWEHFGLISDEEYAKKTCQKLALYEENGLMIEGDVLFSMESENRPLNVRRLEEKMKKYLL